MKYKRIKSLKCIDCGKKISEYATKEKCLSCSKKGHMVSLKTRKKISKKLKGKCFNTREHYIKLSRMFTGRKQTAAHNKAISDGLKGRRLSDETRKKLKEIFSQAWNKVTYFTKHHKIWKLYGKADRCENSNCNERSNDYEWSNISGKYLEDRSDWRRLCTICHNNFDRRRNNESI